MQRKTVAILFLVLWGIIFALTIPSASPVPDGSTIYQAGYWTGSRIGFPAVLAAIATVVIVGIASLVERLRR